MGTESARSTSPHETSFRADPIDAPICEPNAPFPELGWTQPSQSFRFDTAELVAIDDLLDAPGEESNALNSFQQAGTPRIKEEVHEDIEEIPRKPRDRTKEKASLQEPRIPTNFLWKALQETHIELDDSDDEDFDDLWASVRALNQQNNLQSTIQIDDQEKSDCLVIEDGQEKPIKSEPLESEAHGIFGPPPKCIVDDDGVVQILESDDEAPENTRSTLTKSMLRGANPRGQRTAEDVARLRQMQKYYIAAAQRNAKGNEEEPIEIADENAWMQQQTRMTEDKDATQAFMVLRRAYRTKCTKGKNTFEDDFEFGQAEKAHNERQRLLQIELDNDERNEDVESVDGLFFPSPSNKRGKDDQDIEPQEAIRRKHRPKDTDSRTKADFSKELTDNMMAGLPFILGNRNAELQEDGSVQPSKTKPSYKAKKKNIQQSANSNAKGKGKKKCGIAKGFLPPQKTGTSYQQKHLTGTQTLLTSDVFHDTNASANMEGMPVLRGSKKSDAMRDLLKGLDLTEEKQAISDKENILSMGRVLGGVRVADRASGWNMKGMSQVLRHHQIQGAGAMKKREIQEESPRGGILADVMGLGKTVMALMTIIAHPAGPTEANKSTLIVCAPSLIMQWDREISKHIDNKVAGFRVKVFYGLRPDQGGASNWGLKDDLAQADIVLTTYTEVQKSYPRAKLPEDLQTLEEKKAWWLKTWTEERGVLHQIHFYRVVLDEAQAIKNHKGITSVACRGLMAKHRWAMSGTPILNDLGELYPYFKFLRVKNSGSFRTFKQNFCIDGQICMKRLHSFLNGIMIRRTYKTELFHHPIVQLPENHEETIELEFNDLERTIYNTIEERFRRAIARAAAAGDLEKQQRLVLFMLTRLRQLTTHVFMLQETMERMYDLEDADSLYEVMKEARAETTSPADMARSICTMISHKDDSPIRTPPEATPEIEDDDFENAEIEKTTVSRFDKYLRTLVAQMGIDEMNKRTLCQKCQSTPTNPYVTSCMHVYCMECLDTLIVEYAQQDSNEALCVKCNMAFQDTEPCIGLEEMKAGIKPPRQKPKPQLNEIGRPRRKPNDNMKWVEADGKLLQSTKTAAAEAKIEQWLNADSTCKIIVFGQFHMVLKLFAKLCERRNWSHCSYHGKMSQKVRDENLSRFKTDPLVRILVASLKCGAQGLNITEASKVIVVDLWFNTCVEQQAFCRVYRIGQTAETHLTRFVVKDTIDEKLISMQQRKDKIISAAMDDRTVMKNLGLKDMLHLFGQDVTYFHGEEDFVYSDDEDGEEDPIAWDPCMPIGEI